MSSDNDTVTITLGDTLDTYVTGDNLSLDSISTITLTDPIKDPLDVSWYGSDDNSFTIETSQWKNNSITLGDTVLDEGDVKKLKALLDMIENLEDDNELKQMLCGQMALNEIGK